MSDVYGLARFREYMAGLEDCYAVIGGTACDILLREADMRFRATKDIDVILVVEGHLPEVGRAAWRMVADGGYTCGWKSSDRARGRAGAACTARATCWRAQTTTRRPTRRRLRP